MSEIIPKLTYKKNMLMSEATRTYLGSVPSVDIQLAIMGKDPYPTDATGIPFCKPTWNQQLSRNCSGRYVLISMGFEEETISARYNAPINLFEDLLSYGIVFLNASYQYIGNTISKKRHFSYLQEAYEHNKAILESASGILCCGDAKKIKWVVPTIDNRFRFVVHPDVRNKVNPARNSRWKEWWEKDALFDKLLLSIPFRERT
jgi:hypothetical protein